MRNQVFISYSHRDKKLTEELLTHLKPYIRSGSVTAWSDKQIAAGSNWFAEIQEALGKTKVALLLVSPHFLASDFIHDHELGPLLKAVEAGGVKILWVQVRASSYKETPLETYQAVVSPPAKPLAEMKAQRDRAWVHVCEGVKKAVGGASKGSPHLTAQLPPRPCPFRLSPDSPRRRRPTRWPCPSRRALGPGCKRIASGRTGGRPARRPPGPRRPSAFSFRFQRRYHGPHRGSGDRRARARCGFTCATRTSSGHGCAATRGISRLRGSIWRGRGSWWRRPDTVVESRRWCG